VPPTVKSELRRAIYDMVGQIPYGKVATYGQIAVLAGYPGLARQVGYALAGMPEEMDLPWHRVINAQGKISPRAHTKFHELQHVLLEREGIVFVGARVDLGHYGWKPEEEGSGI
jgi:methylated-DNA-protein-cysteine methyltransferase-like protein